MAYTNSTPNYKLPQYVANDTPAWLTDINGAFSAIDTAIAAADQTAKSAEGTATGVASTVSNLSDEVETLTQNIATTDGKVTANTEAIAQANSNIQSLTTRVDTAEGEIDTLQSDVSTLQQAAGLSTYTHSKQGTIHVLAGSGENGQFAATADYVAGDTFLVNGQAATIVTQDGSELGDDFFVTGAYCRFIIKSNNIYFFG